MNKYLERLYNGIIKENPTFVLMLGMCPTLAVTKSGLNGLYMGLTTTLVLVMSNMLISMLRKLIPDKVRMPAFIVIVASFVTIVQLLLQGYLNDVYVLLGLYLPLIVVNCIILGRAESYASKNPVLPSIFDGLGMGLGFTVGLTSIGILRELIGAGKVFDIQVMPASYEPISIFVAAPGAFFVLALLTALQNKFKAPSATNVEAPAGETIACGGNCASCTGSQCKENHSVLERAKEVEAQRIAAEKAKAMEAAKAAAAAKKAAAEAEAAKAAAEAAKAEPAAEAKTEGTDTANQTEV